MSTRFEKTLQRLRNLATEYNRTAELPASLALVGGLALGAWGVVRATRDVDFLLDAGDKQGVEAFLQFLSRLRLHPNSIVSSRDDPLPWLVELPSTDLPVSVHLIVATRAWETRMVSQAIEIELSNGLKVPVVQPGHLLLLKLRAGGPQDLLDAVKLGESIEEQGILEDSGLREMAQRMNIGEEFEEFLRGRG